MMFDRSSVTRIGSATFSRTRFRRSRSPRTRDLRLPDALHLTFELVRGAAQVGDVAQHGEHGVLRADAFAERMREHLEQEVVALVRIDEVELARAATATPPLIAALERNDVNSRLFSSMRAASAGRIVVARLQQPFGAMVLNDDVVRRVGDDDRIGQRIDHRA